MSLPAVDGHEFISLDSSAALTATLPPINPQGALEFASSHPNLCLSSFSSANHLIVTEVCSSLPVYTMQWSPIHTDIFYTHDSLISHTTVPLPYLFELQQKYSTTRLSPVPTSSASSSLSSTSTSAPMIRLASLAPALITKVFFPPNPISSVTPPATTTAFIRRRNPKYVSKTNTKPGSINTDSQQLIFATLSQDCVIRVFRYTSLPAAASTVSTTTQTSKSSSSSTTAAAAATAASKVGNPYELRCEISLRLMPVDVMWINNQVMLIVDSSNTLSICTLDSSMTSSAVKPARVGPVPRLSLEPRICSPIYSLRRQFGLLPQYVTPLDKYLIPKKNRFLQNNNIAATPAAFSSSRRNGASDSLNDAASLGLQAQREADNHVESQDIFVSSTITSVLCNPLYFYQAIYTTSFGSIIQSPPLTKSIIHFASLPATSSAISSSSSTSSSTTSVSTSATGPTTTADGGASTSINTTSQPGQPMTTAEATSLSTTTTTTTQPPTSQQQPSSQAALHTLLASVIKIHHAEQCTSSPIECSALSFANISPPLASRLHKYYSYCKLFAQFMTTSQSQSIPSPAIISNIPPNLRDNYRVFLSLHDSVLALRKQQRLAIGMNNGSIAIFSTFPTLTHLTTIIRHESPIISLSFSPDGQYLASLSLRVETVENCTGAPNAVKGLLLITHISSNEHVLALSDHGISAFSWHPTLPIASYAAVVSTSRQMISSFIKIIDFSLTDPHHSASSCAALGSVSQFSSRQFPPTQIAPPAPSIPLIALKSSAVPAAILAASNKYTSGAGAKPAAAATNNKAGFSSPEFSQSTSTDDVAVLAAARAPLQFQSDIPVAYPSITKLLLPSLQPFSAGSSKSGPVWFNSQHCQLFPLFSTQSALEQVLRHQVAHPALAQPNAHHDRERGGNNRNNNNHNDFEEALPTNWFQAHLPLIHEVISSSSTNSVSAVTPGVVAATTAATTATAASTATLGGGNVGSNKNKNDDNSTTSTNNNNNNNNNSANNSKHNRDGGNNQRDNNDANSYNRTNRGGGGGDRDFHRNDQDRNEFRSKGYFDRSNDRGDNSDRRNNYNNRQRDRHYS